MEYMHRTETLDNMMDKLELRPHHIASFADFEANKDYELSNEEYIGKFRRKNGELHTDKFIILWRDFLKGLHNDPNFEFKYVSGFDSVCTVCDEIDKCREEGHEVHKYTKRLDDEAIKRFPELKFGNTYNRRFLIALFIKKGILKEG